MNKLEQLIKDLCPNGVEHKKLGDLATAKTGTKPKEIYEDCPYNGFEYINAGTTNSGYTLEYNCESDVVTTPSRGQGGIGFVAYQKERFWLGPLCYYIKSKDDKICCNKYLFYSMSNLTSRILKLKKEGGVPALNSKDLLSIIIPVPPLEVQSEIVKILDEYTESVTALQQELEAELTARKKQYEYYRDLLLDFGVHGGGTSDCEWRTIKEIAENCDSKRKPVTKGKRTSGIYPYYGASGIVDYVDNYLFDGDYLLISEDGANLLARSTPIAFSISGKNWVNNHAHVLHFDTYVTRRFVEIYLNSINLEKYISTAAQPKLTQDNLNKIPIPYPTIEEQTRIVNILDRFDKLCNDISEGLPAEIEARRKQYEYYRDKLLSFEEVKA